MLIILGAILVVAGLALTAAERFGLGRLPGDVVVRRGNFTFYFPLMTSILLSIALTVIFWMMRR